MCTKLTAWLPSLALRRGRRDTFRTGSQQQGCPWHTPNRERGYSSYSVRQSMVR
jgi:hypothetical protein